MAISLTSYAVDGYEGKPMVHAYSSPAHWAHALGEHFKETGRTVPRDVRMGRGDRIWANDMLLKVGGLNVKFPTFVREK